MVTDLRGEGRRRGRREAGEGGEGGQRERRRGGEI